MNKLAVTQKLLGNPKTAKLVFAGQKLGYKIQKNSPEILLGVGIATMTASLVGVGIATVKAKDILDEHREHLENIETQVTNTDNLEYDQEDMVHDTKRIYGRLVKNMVILYGPSVLLAGASVFCFCKGQSILKTRNAALAASLAGITEEFRKYREKVVEKYGGDVDEELRYETVKKTVEDENGKKHEIKEVKGGIRGYGPYARVFDDTNDNWQGNAAFVKQWLEMCENHCNTILMGRGVLYLNEVYTMLGFPRTPIGQTHGWVYNPKKDITSNFVDFGMKDFSKENSKAWQLGQTDVIILDFNIDGYVLDKVPDSFE